MEERRVVHRLETIRWSHADDNGDNGDNDDGEDVSSKNGRWLLLSYLPFLVPSQPGTGAGWGGAQRRDPTGGEAYGMDLPIFLAMIFKRQRNSSSGCLGILYSGTLLFSMKRRPKGRVKKSCPADQDVPLDLSLGKVDHLTSRSRSSGIGSSTDWSHTHF